MKVFVFTQLSNWGGIEDEVFEVNVVANSKEEALDFIIADNAKTSWEIKDFSHSRELPKLGDIY